MHIVRLAAIFLAGFATGARSADKCTIENR
jgi:hypothetical protein